MEYYAYLSLARASLSLCHFDWPFGWTFRSAKPHKTTPLKRSDAIDSSDTICFDLIDTRTSRRPTIFICAHCARHQPQTIVSPSELCSSWFIEFFFFFSFHRLVVEPANHRTRLSMPFQPLLLLLLCPSSNPFTCQWLNNRNSPRHTHTHAQLT